MHQVSRSCGQDTVVARAVSCALPLIVDLANDTRRQRARRRLCLPAQQCPSPLRCRPVCSDAKGMSDSTLVYGEIKFEPYAIAFQKVGALEGQSLQTNGSGS
jgi:hypothetical protein